MTVTHYVFRLSSATTKYTVSLVVETMCLQLGKARARGKKEITVKRFIFDYLVPHTTRFGSMEASTLLLYESYVTLRTNTLSLRQTHVWSVTRCLFVCLLHTGITQAAGFVVLLTLRCYSFYAFYLFLHIFIFLVLTSISIFLWSCLFVYLVFLFFFCERNGLEFIYLISDKMSITLLSVTIKVDKITLVGLITHKVQSRSKTMHLVNESEPIQVNILNYNSIHNQLHIDSIIFFLHDRFIRRCCKTSDSDCALVHLKQHTHIHIHT